MSNKRLEKCMELVTEGGVVCDIGTDHALLPCRLVKTGQCKNAIAADIGTGPLEAAKKNILAEGLEDKIDTCLSDGLEDIHRSEYADSITDIVIAGMGGETIVHILSQKTQIQYRANLILQPMTRAEVLRSWLYENGFDIKREVCVEDAGHVYTCIQAVYTAKKRRLSGPRKYIGFADLSDRAALDYTKKQLRRLQGQYEGLAKAGKEEAAEIKQLIDMAEVMINEGK